MDYKFGSAAGKLTPEYLKSIEPPSDALSVGALSDAAADLRDRLAKFNANLADLNARVERIEGQRRDEADFLAGKRRGG
jgi:hypothetical protein